MCVCVCVCVCVTDVTWRDKSQTPEAREGVRGANNLLKPNDIHIYIYIYIYICRTAALTSRRYILSIYSTNIHTEHFKHAA